MAELFGLMMNPFLIAIFVVQRIIGYFLVMKKMPLKRWTCIIPFLAEREMSKVLFRRLRTFYRPFIISVVFLTAAFYLGPEVAMGRIFFFLASVIYGWFLVRLYWRLAQSYGKGVPYRIFTVLFPLLSMIILRFSSAEYKGIEFKPIKKLPLILDIINKILIVLISGAEIAALVLVVGFITIRTQMPAFIVEMYADEFYDKTKDIKGNEEVVVRDAALASYDSNASREKFFPDHSNDKSVVVLEYIVGSNLENGMGLASANVRQMKEATKKGPGVRFVVEAGGSRRWFTKGIDEKSVGRYEIAGGELTKVEELSDKTCMSEQKTLEEFLLWAKEKYTADRYMLVLWDHGGGIPYGYGEDDLNKSDSDDSTIQTSEVVNAIRKSGIKYDVIGFDACLMQEIEIAAALEPYCDYYLASEETEGGYGWYYTDPFGKLAENPGTSTEDFAVSMMSCYDQLNTIIKDDEGKPDTKATLSLVDTTLAKPAYDDFTDFLKKAGEIVKEDHKAFADIATAGANAYNFEDYMQIDLVDYMEILAEADSTDGLGSDEDLGNLTDSIKASVLYRNKDSAKGINGIAFAFPYKEMSHYTKTSEQLKKMKFKDERDTFNIIFSIMAAQKKKAADSGQTANSLVDPDSDSMTSLLEDILGETDYTTADWYVKGFEDYDTVSALVDIPLKETADGYTVDLPDKTKDIITDCQTMVYQKTGDKGDKLKYLGRDHLGTEDDDFSVAFDGNWVHIGGVPVCYEAETPRETDKGTVFAGKVRAKLNDDEDIILNVEWDFTADDSARQYVGHVTGYSTAEMETLSGITNTKSAKNLEPGDTLQFVYDLYDIEGNLVDTKAMGKKVRVIKQGDLSVEDSRLESCDVVFNGVLKDVYQRTMTTEQLEMHID